MTSLLLIIFINPQPFKLICEFYSENYFSSSLACRLCVSPKNKMCYRVPYMETSTADLSAGQDVLQLWAYLSSPPTTETPVAN